MSSPNLAIPLLSSSQSTKYVTVNGAIDLLDSAIAGSVVEAMADANFNVPTADATGYMAFKFTGALTAGRNVVVPANKKLYVVTNGTTGGFAITVKTAGGTGIAITAADGAVLVYCDGTNVIAIAAGGGGGGSSTLAADTDVDITSPANGDLLTYDTGSGKWVNDAPSAGGTLVGDTDVVITSPANNDVLTYETSSTKWKNKPPSGGGGGGGGIPVGSNVYLIGALNSNDSGFSGLSVLLKIDASQIANQATAVKITHALNSGTQTVGAAVLRTSTPGATTFDVGSTPITWGGGNATPTLTAGRNVSDSISFTIDGTKDVWIIIYFSGTSSDVVPTFDASSSTKWGYTSGNATAASTIPALTTSRSVIAKVVTA